MIKICGRDLALAAVVACLSPQSLGFVPKVISKVIWKDARSN